jgi:transposase InsO family protein
VPEHPDTVWSADFMLDALACGRSFRTFNITDDFNREVIHIEVDTSITSQRLVRIFERIRQERPLPQVLRTDNVLTLVSSDSLSRAMTQPSPTAVHALSFNACSKSRGFHVFKVS